MATTAPARSPAAIRRWIICVTRCRRSDDRPTSSGLPTEGAVPTGRASAASRATHRTAVFMRASDVRGREALPAAAPWGIIGRACAAEPGGVGSRQSEGRAPLGWASRSVPMRTIALSACGLLLSASVIGQVRPTFEVASVRPSPEQVNQVNIGVQITGSQVRIAAMSLKDYIGIAYSVRPAQIEGPDWLSQGRFDIAATIPAGVSSDQVDAMLESLLVDRFALKVHRESKEFPVYAIVRTDGVPAPQPVAETAAEAAGGPVVVSGSGTGGGVGLDLGGGSSFNLADNKIEIRRMTIGSLAEMLERFLDRPVVDASA